MKAIMIQKSLAVVVFAVIALAAGAQEHQTYNGPFGRDNAGTATYSYYTGDVWTCRLNRPSEKWINCIRYADGKLQESYTENMQTGDRNGHIKGAAADDGLVGPHCWQKSTSCCFSHTTTRRCPSAAVSPLSSRHIITGFRMPRAISMVSSATVDTTKIDR